MAMKVMIVDPDWQFVIKARNYLESRGNYAVSCTAQDAPSRVLQWQPDLLILAAETGTQDMFNRIQAMPDRPAVLLTEHMSRYDRAWAAWQRGGDELLMKPVFTDEELQDAITIAVQKADTQPSWLRQEHAATA